MPSGCGARARGHEQLSQRDRSKEASHTHIPHGGGQQVQGRVPAGGDQQEDRGHHIGCQPMLFRTCAPLPYRVRSAEGEDICHRIPDGRGAPQQSPGDRAVRHPQQAQSGEGQIYTLVCAP